MCQLTGCRGMSLQLAAAALHQQDLGNFTLMCCPMKINKAFTPNSRAKHAGTFGKQSRKLRRGFRESFKEYLHCVVQMSY
jgi:hypothetical protein